GATGDRAPAAQVLAHPRAAGGNLRRPRQRALEAVSELCFTAPRTLARLLRSRKVSATELMQAFIAQIERVNPKVNAIVTFLPEQALKAAKALDRKKSSAPLAGLPIAYKDLVPTKGIRTTFGSPIYVDNVPTENHAIVERLSHAGTRAQLAGGERLADVVHRRPDGPHRRRHRIPALGNGRPGSALARLHRRARHAVQPPAQTQLQESARRLEPRSRRAAGGAG